MSPLSLSHLDTPKGYDSHFNLILSSLYGRILVAYVVKVTRNDNACSVTISARLNSNVTCTFCVAITTRGFIQSARRGFKLFWVVRTFQTFWSYNNNASRFLHIYIYIWDYTGMGLLTMKFAYCVRVASLSFNSTYIKPQRMEEKRKRLFTLECIIIQNRFVWEAQLKVRKLFHTQTLELCTVPPQMHSSVYWKTEHWAETA